MREARYGAGVQNDKERPTVHGLTNNTVRYARRDTRKNSSAVRVVEPWMPDSIKQAESKEAFKRALKQTVEMLNKCKVWTAKAPNMTIHRRDTYRLTTMMPWTCPQPVFLASDAKAISTVIRSLNIMLNDGQFSDSANSGSVNAR